MRVREGVRGCWGCEGGIKMREMCRESDNGRMGIGGQGEGVRE